MPDSWGGVEIPLVPTAEGADVAVQDPSLTETLRFLVAFLVNDKAASKAWTAIGCAPGIKLVNAAHPVDPKQRNHLFTEKDLPALFLWRSGDSVDEWIGDDWEIETTQLTLFWAFPIATADVSNKRASYINGLAKAIKVAIERGRTPAYKVENDPDYRAGTEGSFFYTANADIMGLVVLRHRPGQLAIEQLPAAGQRPPPPRIYFGLEMTIELKEKMEYGLDNFDAFEGGADTTIKINGGPENVEGRSEPTGEI